MREENPFEQPRIAEQWITSVESEREQMRDRYIYPRLQEWLAPPKIHRVLDLGCGQGIAAQFCKSKEYVGIDASEPLVRRAREQYPEGETFLVGNAYELPVGTETFDGVFSVNVWFHLEDPGVASGELARVLRPGGQFFVVSACPDAYDIWETFYEDIRKEGKRLEGRAHVPHAVLEKNILFEHSQQEVLDAFERAALRVRRTEPFAPFKADDLGDSRRGRPLFQEYEGEKST